MSKREHGIYKYVHDETVVYIGKTDAVDGFRRRIKDHESEHELFNQSEIYIHLCKDKTETDSLETILINAYKPALNKAKSYDYKIEPPELEWIPWELYKNKNKIIKMDDFVSCIETGKREIKIGEKYDYLDLDISIITDSVGNWGAVNFYGDGISIGGNLYFPTKSLLLNLREQINHVIENYDELKEKFISKQYETAKKLYSKNGYVFDVDIMQTNQNYINEDKNI